MRTASRVPPSTSANPKSPPEKTCDMSSAVTTVALVPVGASFTGVTLKVKVLGLRSTS